MVVLSWHGDISCCVRAGHSTNGNLDARRNQRRYAIKYPHTNRTSLGNSHKHPHSYANPGNAYIFRYEHAKPNSRKHKTAHQ